VLQRDKKLMKSQDVIRMHDVRPFTGYERVKRVPNPSSELTEAGAGEITMCCVGHGDRVFEFVAR
jgi:hypothetical protein